VRVEDARAAEPLAAGLEIGPDVHLSLAVVEVLPAAVPVHEVHAAVRPERIGEEQAVDPLAAQFVPDEGAHEVVAQGTEEGGAQAQAPEGLGGAAAGLADVVEVLGEVRLDAPVDVLPEQEDVRVHADAARDNGVEWPRRVVARAGHRDPPGPIRPNPARPGKSVARRGAQSPDLFGEPDGRVPNVRLAPA